MLPEARTHYSKCVPYDVARMLKNAGYPQVFDQNQLYYDRNGRLMTGTDIRFYHSMVIIDCAAPTYGQAFDFLSRSGDPDLNWCDAANARILRELEKQK